jgi:hypothetical protein
LLFLLDAMKDHPQVQYSSLVPPYMKDHPMKDHPQGMGTEEENAAARTYSGGPYDVLQGLKTHAHLSRVGLKTLADGQACDVYLCYIWFDHMNDEADVHRARIVIAKVRAACNIHHSTGRG